MAETTDRDALQNLLDAVAPVLAAHRSTARHVSEEQITRAWAAYDAGRALLRSSATTEAQRQRARRRAKPLSGMDEAILRSLRESPGLVASDLAMHMGLPSNAKGMGGSWRGKGKRAGILRNLEMLDQKPALVVAFQRNDSTGTQHTIDEARRRGIPVAVNCNG